MRSRCCHGAVMVLLPRCSYDAVTMQSRCSSDAVTVHQGRGHDAVRLHVRVGGEETGDKVNDEEYGVDLVDDANCRVVLTHLGCHMVVTWYVT